VKQVGRYQILEELGRGAGGVVYRALDPAIGRTVAIKSIRFSESFDPDERRDLRERVLREAQSAGKLSHPNIVTIYDVLESNDLAYIFMEFVDGSSLKDAMRRDAPPGREQVLSFLRQIASALDYAHRKGIIHRDIKPANIMISDRGVDRDGVAKIADFGVAKLLSHEATHQRALMGTPSYMSPEQLEGVAVGGPSDQFALAVVVYELLTGEKPFSAGNLAALHYFICKRPARPPKELNPLLSETVNRVMERALSKLPEDRYGSCSEFVGALSVALGDCGDWQPVAPPKMEEEEQPARNGWYAPETVISSRLIEGGSARGEWIEEPVPIDPVVLPPAANAFDTSLSPRLATYSQQENYEGGQRHVPGPRSEGTRVRIGVERPAARHLAVTMVACAAVALLGILWLRFLSGPRAAALDQESKRVVTVAPPEDLSATSRQASAPPADLTTAPVLAPVAAGTNSGTTTVDVRVPIARHAIQRETPPVQDAPPAKLRAPARNVPSPAETISDVELVGDPPGARVVVDNRADTACLAPCNVSLAPGRHTLSAELGGYGTARKIFNVPLEGSVFVSMLRNMGMLMLTSEPAGTTVTIDGKDMGPTPVRVNLPAGPHHLSLTDGARHHDETIQIDTDGAYVRSFRW
jgi:serine/threonine protein kinase